MAASQIKPSLMALSLIVMSQDPLRNLLDSDMTSLVLMKIVRFIVLALPMNFADVYINLVLMVLVLHISQLVQCGVVLLNWSIFQSKKVFFRKEYLKNVALLAYQLNISHETYIKMLLISNFMEETYFYISPVLLSIGGCILITCNFACIRMAGIIDSLFTLSFAGMSSFILVVTAVLFPLADSVYENYI